MIKHHQPDKSTPNQPAADSVQDRTQQQRDQVALRQLEEKYHRLFNAIDEAFCTIEVLFDDQGKAVDYRFLETNPAFLRQTGLENVISQRVLEVVPNLEQFWFDTYGHVAKTGDAIRFEHQALAMNRYYDVYAFRVDEPNQNHVAVIFNDITQRKCHQANLGFLAEVSQDLAGLTNIDETMTALGAKIAGHFKLVEVIFGEMSDDEQTVHISHEWHRADYPAVKGTYTVNAYFSPEFEGLHRAGQIGIVRDTTNDERVDAAGYAALGIGAFVNVPIIHHNKWRFNVTLLDANPRNWRDDEIELMRELITRIWTRLDRARTEEALRESQERLRLVLDASGMGTFLWYPQEDRTEADARAFTLLGLGENDTITLAESLASSIHPDDRERYTAAVARALERKGDGKLDLDYRIVQPDGSLHWLHIYGHTFFSSENPTRAKLLYGLFLDITQRKRHEAHLAFLAEVSQELVRLTTISETMNALGAKIGHHFMASRCAFFEFNEAMESAVCHYDWHQANEPSLVGTYRTADFYTDEFLETMRAGEAFVVTDREADSRADATNLAALRIASCIVMPIITRQQSLFVLAINDTVPRDWHQDEIELMRELAERIWTRLERARAEEALHESQKRFESIANLVPDLLWDSHPDGSTNWYNQRWLDYTGQHFDEAIGWGWIDAIHPDDRDASAQRYNEAVEVGQLLRQEHRIRRHDGVYRWFVVSVSPLKDATGQVVNMYGAATDIDDRKRLEASLLEADRRKDEFLAMLAHELRNPMSTIRSGLQILALTDGKDQTTGPAVGRDPIAVTTVAATTVALMNRQTDQLVRLVDDLLDVSRISQGKIELKPQRVNLVEVVAQAAESLQAFFHEQGRRLHVEVPTAPIYIEGDGARLTQVVTNLLTNGARYTQESGQVWLSLRHQSGMWNHGPSGAQEALIEVTDNGIGLAADQLVAIFELFVQVDNSLARSKGGLGLGLTLVKRLVELHGGWVEAHSEGIGKGSTFRIHLPTLHSIPEPVLTPTEDNTVSVPTHRILIIDDNADAALMLSMLLRLKGYEVHSRPTGGEGIQAAESLRPAVILCDIGMPVLDGYATCQLIRGQPWGQSMGLIALTGYGQAEDKQRAQEAGFDGHLVKPVDTVALLKLLNDLLDKGKKRLV